MDFEVIHQHGNSGSSSSEELNDHHHDQANENAVLGRFYECMFCKRGFTNAQALGGHMNIHRKEKAKAKMQKANQCLVSSKSAREELLVIDQRYYDNFLLGDQQNHQYYEVPVGGQMSYQYFFPGSNPNFSHQEYEHDLCDFVDHDPKKEINHRDPNLMSMQIGPPRQNGETKNDQTWKDQSEVDLELRLGLAL